MPENPEKPEKSEVYLQMLVNSKDSLYAQILEKYSRYLLENPADAVVSLERCKVIENAYYDAYEDYNPNYEEFEICLNELVRNFPYHQEVLLYKLKNVYGDSAISFCEKVIAENRSNPGKWDNSNLAFFYEELARQYSYKDEVKKVLENAEIAESLNDSLDLSLLMARQYMASNNYDGAKYQLLRSLDTLDLAWESQEKAKLLLQLGMPSEALEAFAFARRDTTAWIDNGVVANALMDNGMFAEAREYLVKDLNESYDQSSALHKLFAYDYKYSPADTALVTYKALIRENFWNDAFGKYRLMMAFRTPFEGWSANDMLKLLLFLLAIIVFLILPYLWILPLHYVSGHFKINAISSLPNAHWGLKAFWLISSAILILDFTVMLVFSYKDLIGSWFVDYYAEEETKISLSYANLSLCYFIGMLILVLALLKKQDYRFLLKEKWPAVRGVAVGLGLAFLLRVVYFTLARWNILPGADPAVMGSITDDIVSINTYYHPLVGFLFVVILVPFYEEYLFRAIALTAMEKRVKFAAANILQAVFFALMHDDYNLFIFYFSFGIIAGLLVRKSKSLTPGIAFHATNNLLAFIAIMRVS